MYAIHTFLIRIFMYLFYGLGFIHCILFFDVIVGGGKIINVCHFNRLLYSVKMKIMTNPRIDPYLSNTDSF